MYSRLAMVPCAPELARGPAAPLQRVSRVPSRVFSDMQLRPPMYCVDVRMGCTRRPRPGPAGRRSKARQARTRASAAPDDGGEPMTPTDTVEALELAEAIEELEREERGRSAAVTIESGDGSPGAERDGRPVVAAAAAAQIRDSPSNQGLANEHPVADEGPPQSAVNMAATVAKGLVGLLLLPARQLLMWLRDALVWRAGSRRRRAARDLEWAVLAHKIGKLEAPQLTSILTAVSHRCPDQAAAWFERWCLGRGPNPVDPEDRIPVSAETARAYIAALVAAGRLGSFGTEETAAAPSLARMLDTLRAALEGQDPETEPGSSPTRPLHIVLNGGGSAITATAGRPADDSWFGTIKQVLWSICINVAIILSMSLLMVVGMRIAQRAAGGASGSAVGSGPAGGGLASGGLGLAPKEYNRDTIPEKSVKTFKDIKGCDEAIAELREIVEYLKTPEKFTKLGGKLPKGVLLTGSPGTGKTLLARAVAGEAGVPFFYKSGSEFDEMFVGVGSRRVRTLFAAAKAKSPCIIFIDELDSIGGKRTSWESQAGGSRKTLNQLLTEMDGFEENSGVVVMAATNLPELLDPALLRPGRFDRQVGVALPDVDGRLAILELYLRDKPLAADVDVESLARRTPGFSGAQLANLANEAALLAARHGRSTVDAATIDEARDKILMGSPRALSQTPEARRLTAYHEGGHALVALFTPGARPIHKATIVPRGQALGMVTQVPDRDEYSTTKQQLLAQIDVCMGGKAAEELVFGEEFVTTGATSDLRSATRTARHMVEDCGMSEAVGPVWLDRGGGSGGREGSDAVGDEVRRLADAEVSRLLRESYDRVRALLSEHAPALHALAQTLLERETLGQEQIRHVVERLAPQLRQFRADDDEQRQRARTASAFEELVARRAKAAPAPLLRPATSGKRRAEAPAPTPCQTR